MSSPTDAHLERLIRALAAMPDDRASALVDEAWEQAEASVRDTLAAAMQAALLRRAVGLLEGEERPDVSAPPDDQAAAPEPRAPAPEPSRVAAEPSPAASEPGTSVEQHAELVWYAYAVTPAGAEAPLDRVEPMAAGAPVETVRSGDLAVLASGVPASEFGPEALQDRLHDTAWLEDAARRHDSALRPLLDMHAFVPLRFCTIVRSREDLARFLDEYAVGLRSALDVVAGRSEWGLKVSTDPERIHEHLKATNDEIHHLEGQISGQPAGGKAYFLDKRLTQLLDEEAERLATAEAGGLHERLGELAVRTQLLPLQRQEEALSGAARMVLNGAYLVPDERWEAFEADVRTTAEGWASLGLVAELSGPWPPYSFVDLDLTLDAAGERDG